MITVPIMMKMSDLNSNTINTIRKHMITIHAAMLSEIAASSLKIMSYEYIDDTITMADMLRTDDAEICKIVAILKTEWLTNQLPFVIKKVVKTAECGRFMHSEYIPCYISISDLQSYFVGCKFEENPKRHSVNISWI